ncbi:hypothetical protein NA56DRAFT_452872 [Hyaloscypha hepaticicola]|uniref:Uncharacterized protein n=1 Tax=Hyaloscypha hepaticicola TaxID=2082293 RepID=A0A2J6PFK1_9HELO|nr:hypothetical protein NA56DRAFT_452872 [Hyaloscypha hepaticicola]
MPCHLHSNSRVRDLPSSNSSSRKSSTAPRSRSRTIFRARKPMSRLEHIHFLPNLRSSIRRSSLYERRASQRTTADRVPATDRMVGSATTQVRQPGRRPHCTDRDRGAPRPSIRQQRNLLLSVGYHGPLSFRTSRSQWGLGCSSGI